MRHLTSQQMQEFLDRSLSPAETASVEEHLSACPACREELDGWRLLFSDLETLPELEPASTLSERVMAELPLRRPLGARVRRWVGIGSPEEHLPQERIQELLDGSLSSRQAGRARKHLAACRPCQEEASAWERVFAPLASLSRFAPSAGFAERVMARVRFPTPVPSPLAAAGGRARSWARRLLPRDRRSWAVMGGMASAPTITMAALLYMVFSHPTLTAGTFATYAYWKVAAALSSIYSLAAGAAVESTTLMWAYSLAGSLLESPLLVGAGGLAFSIMSALALWVLYRNLVAASKAEEPYVRVRS